MRMIQTVKTKLQDVKRRILAANRNRIEKVAYVVNLAKCELAAAAVGGLSVSTAYAETDAQAKNIIVSIVGQIITLFPAVGIVIALVGGFKLFMAFRNDQPDAYSGAVKDIVIGALLIGFERLMWSGGASLKDKF